MKYLLINFNNKSSLYMFCKILKNYSINYSIINTPHSISRSCSLSLKINLNYLNTLLNIVKTSHISDVAGIFLLERQGFNERIQRLYWLISIFLISYFYGKNW